MVADDQPARGGAVKHEGEPGRHPHFLPVLGVAGGSACGEHRRVGYFGGLTSGGARPAGLSLAMICCRYSIPYSVKAVTPSSAMPSTRRQPSSENMSIERSCNQPSFSPSRLAT